jgi:hypothetical protein
MIGETPARNPIKLAAPNFGLTPNRMLAPPAINATPVAATAISGFGTFFEAVYCVI